MEPLIEIGLAGGGASFKEKLFDTLAKQKLVSLTLNLFALKSLCGIEGEMPSRQAKSWDRRERGEFQEPKEGSVTGTKREQDTASPSGSCGFG